MVSATTRAASEGSSLGMRDGRVLSSTPCRRQTQVFDLPLSHAFVPSPSALSIRICALRTCFCGAWRSLTKARSRSTSAGVIEGEMPVRMPRTRMPRARPESPPGFQCQILFTSSFKSYRVGAKHHRFDSVSKLKTMRSPCLVKPKLFKKLPLSLA
jgi:hypothetical protein